MEGPLGEGHPLPLVAVVTGSSNVGRATIEALLSKHAGSMRLRACARSSGKLSFLDQCANVEIVEGVDAFDKESLERALNGATKALLVAPKTADRDEAVNHMIDAAKQCGVKHVVLIGGVQQADEVVVMHKQWQSSRRHAEAVGMTWTQLECVDFMENVLGHRQSILTEGRFYGAGKGGASPAVAVQDIGAAAAAVLASSGQEHNNRAYRIVGPEPLGPEAMAAAFSRVLKKPVEFVDIGIQRAREVALASGAMARWQVEGFFDWMQRYFMTGALMNVKSDLPLLGVQPISFESWLLSHQALFQ